MKLRSVLALQLVLSFLVLACFVAIAGRLFWATFRADLPSLITVGPMAAPTPYFLVGSGALLLLFASLVYFLLYLTLERLIIRPVLAIANAMKTFTESHSFSSLSEVSTFTAEIREFITVFAQFAESVEQIHQRDMEISRVKSDFISTAAHQLRTPLTGIRWALEALEKESLTENQKSLVENAKSKSKDLVAIVGTLLDISSIESGKHKYTFSKVDLLALVNEVVADFTVQAAEGKVLLSIVPPEEALPLAHADREQVKWVLNNLVENGIRYTPQGGSVQVSLDAFPERVQVHVRDTGIGITPKDRNNIFERFYRADNAIAKENKGNGLGLYIARTIATDHGGDLDFSPNKNGPGTTFTLSLPRA